MNQAAPQPAPQRIERQDLPPVSAGPQPTYRQATAPSVSPVPVSPSQPRYATPSPQVPAAASGPAGWNSQGGSSIVVGQGETIGVLANRYGIPASAILAANGLTNAQQVQPGQRLTIPTYNVGGGNRVASAAPLAATPRPAPAATPRVAAPPRAPVVATPVVKAVAAAKPETIRPTPTVKPLATPKPVAAAPLAAAPVQAPAKVAAVQPVAPQKAAEPVKTQPAPAPVAAAPAPKAQEPEPADQTASIARDGTEFRWPARGRIIAGFNGKGGNEGINIALPEGTPIKAAEGGTVAYAGSELKGYGNLVLIRHDNGFVSAYAHNGEIAVKRGEKVRRGQTIAKSGQTGNVSSPQLHFELRKGSTPVDPIQHLTGL